MTGDYMPAALRIVPIGSKPSSVTELRRQIAAAIAENVALARDRHCREATSLHQRMLTQQEIFNRIKAGHLQFLDAAERLLEWCNDPTQPGCYEERWQALKQAWQAYKSLK